MNNLKTKPEKIKAMATKKKTTQNPEPSNDVKQPPAQPFKTISDVVNDPHFIRFVGENIEELKASRRARPEAKAGYHYKRDWFDRMADEGNLNRTFFIESIEAIWLKKSLLSSQERHVISFVCDKSFHQALAEHLKSVGGRG